jgi:hypothetical protein
MLCKLGEEEQPNEHSSGLTQAKDFMGSHVLGELSAIPPMLLASSALDSSQKKLHELKDEDLKKLLKTTKLKDKVYLDKPKLKKRRAGGENAWYDGRPYEEILENKSRKKYRKGSVHATSLRMWRPGVVAHELGHADIARKGGLVGFLQRYLYGPTRAINRATFGAIPTALSFKANEDEDDKLKGFLRGGAIGAGLNAGVLVPEIEASRRGIKHLLKTSLSPKRKLLNALSMIPAFSTYLLGAAGPSAFVGAYKAHKNKKKKEKKKKTKQAEFFSKIAGFIKASGSDIDIMFDKKVETDPKNPFDGRLKKNKSIVEVKEKELETPKLHTHKIKIALEKLRGGQGDNKSDESFSSSELRKGTKHELEHTESKSQAKEIAKDHLSEVKNYYTKLDEAGIE